MTAVPGLGGVGIEGHLAATATTDKPHQVEVAKMSALEQPDASHTAAFSQALSQPPVEVQAPAPSEASIIRSDISRRVEALSAHLTTWQNGTSAANPTSANQLGLGDASTTVGSLTSQMKGAYTFAIETTLLSHGSTESTKIFNTLLKGQ